MKKAILFSSLLFIVAGSLQAQIPDLQKAGQGLAAAANPGSLLTQFVSNIKPSAFKDNSDTQKSGILGAASKITSAAAMAQNVSSIIKLLKPGAFKQGFNVQSLLQTANTVKTMSSAAGMLKGLQGGLKPESMTDAWSGQQTGWLSALNLLK